MFLELYWGKKNEHGKKKKKKKKSLEEIKILELFV